MNPNEEKELMQMWQSTTLPNPGDPRALAREIGEKVTRFDKKIANRNLREYAAGAILFAWCGAMAFNSAQRDVALVGMAAAAFITFYLWQQHRRVVPLDPAGDAHIYKAALLMRIDNQIRLLRSAKYWYVLPGYLFMLAAVLKSWSFALPSYMALAGFTAFSAFIVWLNESYGVRKLLVERQRIESIFNEPDAIPDAISE